MKTHQSPIWANDMTTRIEPHTCRDFHFSPTAQSEEALWHIIYNCIALHHARNHLLLALDSAANETRQIESPDTAPELTQSGPNHIASDASFTMQIPADMQERMSEIEDRTLRAKAESDKRLEARVQYDAQPIFVWSTDLFEMITQENEEDGRKTLDNYNEDEHDDIDGDVDDVQSIIVRVSIIGTQTIFCNQLSRFLFFSS